MQYNATSVWRSRAFHKPLTFKSRYKMNKSSSGNHWKERHFTLSQCDDLSGVVTENESRKVERQGPGLKGITCQEKEFGYAL